MNALEVLLVLPILPAIALMFLVYKQDRIEKEPKELVVYLMLLGAVSCLPAMGLEHMADAILKYQSEHNDISATVYNIYSNFLGVALMEEGVKHLAARQITWKHPSFDYTLDGVVYCVASSLGFAALENILYFATSGMSQNLALMRALTAVPGHCIFGIYMGHFLGKAKRCKRQKDTVGKWFNMFLSMFVPVMIHGFYDFVINQVQSSGDESSLWFVLFLVFIITLDVVAIIQIKGFSKADAKL